MLAGERAQLEALRGEGIGVFVVGACAGDRVRISAADAEVDLPLAAVTAAWGSLDERAEAVTAV